jgi:hypothetical protein
METLLAEIRLFRSRIGSLRSILPHLALLLAFGFMIPKIKGLDFLDSQVLGAYACLAIIFAPPATAQAFPAGARTSFQQAKARILVSVVYGEIVSITLLAAGIATVYLTQRGSFVPQPDWESLARSAMFGLGASAMLSSLAALITVRFSRSLAMICLRLAFFGLLILFYFRGRWLPDIGLAGATGCLVVAGLEIELLRRTCR